MKKTTIIALVFIMLLLSLAFVAVFYKKTVPPSSIQPSAFVTPLPIRPSAMPQSISNGPIVYTGGATTAVFPKSASYFAVSRHRDFETERTRLFSLYDVVSSPATIIGAKGRYTSFSGAGKSGTVSENPLTFAFHTTSTSKKTVTNNINKYLTTVTGRLSELSVLPAIFKPTLSSQRFFTFDEPHPSELTGSEKALITKLDFAVAVEGLPVFIGDADTPVFSAGFNGDDVLVELRGFILPDITKGTQNIAIISYESALERLKNNTGVFSSVSLSASGDKEFMTGGLPSSVQIEKAVLGYYYSPLQDYLVPVFVFSGVAQEPGEKAVLRTTMVVSAL